MDSKYCPSPPPHINGKGVKWTASPLSPLSPTVPHLHPPHIMGTKGDRVPHMALLLSYVYVCAHVRLPPHPLAPSPSTQTKSHIYGCAPLVYVCVCLRCDIQVATLDLATLLSLAVSGKDFAVQSGFTKDLKKCKKSLGT